MKVSIQRIGRAAFLPIPDAFLKQCGIKGRVNVGVEGSRLVVSAQRRPRDGWDAAFRAVKPGRDIRFDTVLATEWEREGWDW